MARPKTRKKTSKKLPPAKRLARYRARAARRGIRRVEVAVPKADIKRIRNVARAFREGGAAADSLRNQVNIRSGRPLKIAKTGAEFLDMLRERIGKGVRLELPPREYEEPRDTGF